VAFLVVAIVIVVIATVAAVVTEVARSTVTASGAIGTVGTSVAAPRGDVSINAVLRNQSAALVAGNQAAFMAAVDPGSKTVVAAYRRLYANLRALHVASWNQSAPGGNDRISAITEYDVDVSYCLVVTTCKGMTAELTITAAVKGGRILIESYRPPAASQRLDEPIPWQTEMLTAVTGPQVVVAAAASEKSKLAEALPIAVRAAAAAGAYAHWGRPPVYLVYLAGVRDAKTWFGGGLEHSTGEAIGLSATDIEVMVVLPEAGQTRYAGPGQLATVIQHEMGHVVTLYGDDQDTGHDSFIEGIAEYVAYTGHPTWAEYRLENTREYLQSGKWSGQCYLTSEISSDDVLTGSAAYGIGYLTIRHLASKYGTAKMLEFWGSVERNGQTPDQAARRVLGAPWKTVNADCASYIRHTLRVA
jgi:hypothetical protein